MGKADISTRNSRRKIHLVFDEKKRRDFLTGFHKRKLQRKKAAKEKLEKELKEEKKRLKQEAKESYKKLVASHRSIPELENLLSEEYEDDDVNVKVLELSSFALANQSNWIGPNHTRYEPDEGNHSEKESDEDCEVPGMELEEKQREREEATEKHSKQSFSSEKDLKRSLKKQATKNVQDSKVFQLKNKMERQRQKKKALRQKRLKYKIQEKQKKRRRK